MVISQPAVGNLCFLPSEVLVNPTTKTYFANAGMIGANAPLGRVYHLVIRGLNVVPAMLLPTFNLYVDAVPVSGSPVNLLAPSQASLLATGGTYPFSITVDLQVTSGAGSSSCGLTCMGTALIMTGSGNDVPKVLDGGTSIMIDNTQNNAIAIGVMGNTNASRTMTLRQLIQSVSDLRTS